MGVCAMGNIRKRADGDKLFFDFRYEGKRCRELTALKDTPANRKKLKLTLSRIEAEITLGSFEYGRYFPNSPMAQKIIVEQKVTGQTSTPLFKDIAQTWLDEMAAQWRHTHHDGVLLVLRKYIYPAFENKEVGLITKADILKFRSTLAKVTKQNGNSLSATRINHIITPLRMILNESANRYEFTSPYHGIKSLKVPKTDVEPFTLDEVKLIINSVRTDFRHYYCIRFFTGMRTSEIDGLQWQFVDFERRQILVRHALVKGEFIYTKNNGSFRTIDMSQVVHDSLKSQHKLTGHTNLVFCNQKSLPLNHNNVNNRVWKPLLKHLNLRQRRPYQTRHTAATIWLAAGESPEWIARQMGHSSTEMLFRVYSRFVPNLTRQDGTAFERLLNQHIGDIS